MTLKKVFELLGKAQDTLLAVAEEIDEEYIKKDQPIPCYVADELHDWLDEAWADILKAGELMERVCVPAGQRMR